MAKVDDGDYDLLAGYKWFAFLHHGTWYAGTCIYSPEIVGPHKHKVELVRMHRLVMACVKGDRKIVDHKDGDGLNNQRDNLRIASKNGNAQNAKAKYGKKYKGVYVNPSGRVKGWTARINIPNTEHEKTLGCFETRGDAALAYNEAAKLYHGEYARLNEVDPEDLVRENKVKIIPPENGRCRGVFNRPAQTKSPWVAKINTNGKIKYLGSYKTQREAAAAYNNEALRVQGQYAVLNDLDKLD